MTARLEVTKLRAAYGGRTAVDVAELSVAGGELLVVVGGAGSGKSTFAAALAGAMPARGEVRVDGKLVTGTPSQRRTQGIAVALRDGGRLSGCTVLEALHLAARGTSRANEALEHFRQLGTRGDVLVQLLSGGEQQLLRVATAWCATPRVLVLDAPTVGLAQEAAHTVAELARGEAARGAAVLWLEQDVRAAPAPPALTIERGSVAPVSPAKGQSPEAE